jgi:hypothetical protein
MPLALNEFLESLRSGRYRVRRIRFRSANGSMVEFDVARDGNRFVVDRDPSVDAGDDEVN